MNTSLLSKNITSTFYLKLILILFCLVFNTERINAQVKSNFLHLDPKQNNKSLSIIFTIQDHDRYIWMVHSQGFEKYDGYNYLHISINQIFKNPKPNDYILYIQKDYKNNIWITSKYGLVSVCDTLGRFNEIISLKGKKIQIVHTNRQSVILCTKNGEIYKYNLTTNILNKITTIPNISPQRSEIRSVAENKSNELFISTDKGKIYHYSPKRKQLQLLRGPFSDYPGSLYLTFDLKNTLWIGTQNMGLFAYDLESKKYIQNSIYKSPLYNIKNELVISLFCDSSGIIWTGTDGGGLYRVNPNDGSIQLFAHQESNKFSLSSNTVLNINEDNHKNLWVLTNYGGVNILPKEKNIIDYHEGSENKIPTRVLSIYKSKSGALWAGTDGSGLTKITTTKDGIKTAKQYFNDTKTKGFFVQSMVEDAQTNIWFGTYKNGLWQYNSNQNSFKKIPVKNAAGQEASDVRTIFIDSKKRIWVGSNLSVNVYNSNQKLLAAFKNNTQGLQGSICESIIEEQNGTIWLAFYKGGLFKLQENKESLAISIFKKFSYYNEKIYSNDILGIRSMALAEPNIIWFINSHGRLIKYNTSSHKHQSFKDFYPLKKINLKSVLTDKKNNLWLSSSNGILNFNPKDSTVNTYLDTDGLQDNEFLPRSAYKDEKGKLYFGGIKGLNAFEPKNISHKKSKAKLYINSIEILNQPAISLIPEQLNTGVENLKQIKLEANQSSFSFRFSAIDDILNPNYYYAYRLLGFNNNWIPVHKEQLATYTNIPSGSYTFEIKAGSKEGIWDIPMKKIDIKIAQPFWNKPLAYLIYILLLGFIIYGIKKWYDLKKNLIFEKVNHKKEIELHELKMNFLSIMSHELQTPLTLILSPLEDMLSQAKKNGNLLLEQRLQIIANNAKRLSQIVFKLTSIRNRELEKIRLLVTPNNMFEELNQIGLSFKEQARFNHIDFTINCPKNLSEAWYDKDKIEHVIYNLLSNAFKFTPKEGNIQLIATPINDKKSIKISIIDSGPGIPNSELKNIFTIFYQSKIGKQTKGTGIGLALSKELMDLHRGKIEVNSSAIQGTSFTITFPIAEQAYLDDEKVITDITSLTVNISDSLSSNEVNSIIETKKHDKTILIVEDNFELQDYLRDILSGAFNVILADNGKTGFEYAKENLPNLILSDIMMDKMDGIEMCKMLQNTPQTKHIPVILITAMNSTNSKILGLQSGAIQFINKPFDTNELLLKINNIIKSTEYIISHLKTEKIKTPAIQIEKSQDDVFLENLVAAINSQIENSNFKMEELADIMNLSYSVVYRKCQALTGESLVDLVRLLRLKKAAVVIAKFGYSISEAAYLSGFNDPKYFSKCFKKQFGKTPNTFKKEAQQLGSEKYLQKYNLDK